MYEELAKIQLRSITNQIKEVFPTASHFFIAGGAVRDLLIGVRPKDYDVFFKKHKDAIEFLKTYTPYLESNKVNLICVTKNAVTVEFPKSNGAKGAKVQFITNPEFCKSPDETIKRFDFKCCMAYYDSKFNQIGIPSVFIRDQMKNKRLVFNPKCYRPVQSIRRMYKFRARGWKISSGQFLKVVWYSFRKSTIGEVARTIVSSGGY